MLVFILHSSGGCCTRIPARNWSPAMRASSQGDVLRPGLRHTPAGHGLRADSPCGSAANTAAAMFGWVQLLMYSSASIYVLHSACALSAVVSPRRLSPSTHPFTRSSTLSESSQRRPLSLPPPAHYSPSRYRSRHHLPLITTPVIPEFDIYTYASLLDTLTCHLTRLPAAQCRE